MGSVVELCTLRRAATRPRDDRTPLRCPPLSAPGSIPGQKLASTPQGMDALRTGIAATARSASLPRPTGLLQFHPEDVERSETQN